MPADHPYPVFLDLHGRDVLVIGGGAVALRKTRGLLEAGARVTLVAPDFAAEFSRLGRFRKIRRAYAATDMKARQWRLIFAATDSPAVNARVRKDSARAGFLCCRCDDPEDSDFSGAATAQAGGVTLAIGTANASPALSARIRDQAAAAIDGTLAHLAALLLPWRARAKRLIADPQLRRALLQQLSGAHMESVLRKHGPRQAQALFTRWLAEAQRVRKSPAGPAAPRRGSLRASTRTRTHDQ